MRVAINKSWGDDVPFGIYGLTCSFIDATDLDNHTILDRDVAPVASTTRPINNHPITNNDIVGHFLLLESGTLHNNNDAPTCIPKERDMAAYRESNVPNQSGKTFIVTGANTGIGFDAARVLALRGGRVLLACRSKDKAEQALANIRKTKPDADVSWLPLDLASLASIRNAAALAHQETRIDGLINNAGVMIPPKTLTEDGFELQFGVNHLGLSLIHI